VRDGAEVTAAAAEAEVFEGRFPHVFDRRGIADVALPFVTGLLCWGVVVRDREHDGTDPAALILTLLALLAGTQAIFGVIRIARRVGLGLRRRQHRLTLEPDRLILETPKERTVVTREDIVAIRERGHWGKRAAGRRFSPVFIVTRPSSGRTHLTLPPVFGESPGLIAEALMRWRGPVEAPEDYAPPAPARLPSRIYDDAVRGKPSEGTVVVRHGRAWLARGPYITALMGITLVIRWLRFDAPTARVIGPEVVVIVAFVGALVPLGWILLSLRELRPRKGLALVITPAEVLVRTRGGVLQATFRNLTAPKIEQKTAWSVLFGLTTSQTLVITRGDAPPIRYEEAFLGLPAEVAASLLEAMKRGTAVT